MGSEFDFDDEYHHRPRYKRRQAESGAGLIIGGYVCAFLALLIFPPGFGVAGAACGIISMARGHALNGILIVVLSITCAAVGMILGEAVFAGRLKF